MRTSLAYQALLNQLLPLPQKPTVRLQYKAILSTKLCTIAGMLWTQRLCHLISEGRLLNSTASDVK